MKKKEKENRSTKKELRKKTTAHLLAFVKANTNANSKKLERSVKKASIIISKAIAKAIESNKLSSQGGKARVLSKAKNAAPAVSAKSDLPSGKGMVKVK